jgi:phospholipid/cholesterol/gamma-HCH transport system substrate-binding protein
VNRKLRADLIKLGIFTVVAVLITTSVVATLLDLKLTQPQTGFHAIFTNASGLESGDTVRIAGVEVGKVTGVSVTKEHQAKVDFTVASSQHLTTATLASIQFENLLGQRYLQISQGAPGGKPLRSGATIPDSETTPGLDLTAVFSGFQPLLAALNPQQVNDLTNAIIQVFQGQSGAVGNLIDQTAALTSNLGQQQTSIDEILDNLTPLLTKVNSQDTNLQSLIAGLAQLAKGLNGSDQGQGVGNTVTALSQLTQAASGLLNGVQPALDRDISGLSSAANVLNQNQTQLDTVIKGLPGLLSALDKASSSGNYLTVYICDLTVQTSGPISVKLSPGVPQSPPLAVPTGAIGNQVQQTQVCKPGGG